MGEDKMKTCNGCKFADWKRTVSGKLHPSGGGKCAYEYVPRPLPASMYYWLGSGNKPFGGYINRREELNERCVYYSRGEVKGEMKMEWKIDIGQYTSGELLFLGKWNVGKIHYDSCRPRNDPLKYAAKCMLPGIKSVLGHFETEAEAKDSVERAVTLWLSKLPQHYL
jgi:hypothetical protein